MNSRGGHNHGGPRHHSYTQGPPSPSSEFPPLSGQVHPKPHNKWPQKGGYIQQKGNHEHPGVGASSSTQGHHSSPSDLATNMSEMSIGGSKAREVGPGGAAILPTPPPGVQEVIPPTTQMQQPTPPQYIGMPAQGMPMNQVYVYPSGMPYYAPPQQAYYPRGRGRGRGRGGYHGSRNSNSEPHKTRASEMARGFIPSRRPDEVVVSIDVECAASGYGHNQRTPVLIGMVNAKGEQILRVVIKPEVEIVSYLTDLTGVTKEDCDAGVSFEEAIKQVKAKLDPEVTRIVGYSIHSDIEWLQLTQGKDFKDLFNLTEYFMASGHNSKPCIFSLKHLAVHLLDIPEKSFHKSSHDPVEDAKICVDLYAQFVPTPKDDLQRLQARLMALPTKSATIPVLMEGVCMKKFYKPHCPCRVGTKSTPCTDEDVPKPVPHKRYDPANPSVYIPQPMPMAPMPGQMYGQYAAAPPVMYYPPMQQPMM
eukprot:TRINITY_DN1467_c1_g2_i1.p1 TRINITY_DN1467_c1_g2~~TRINITY_DN1467_c1_g2_i1.p1  ORF type:complete len:476 (+),score=108.54 TRINITY_DN1467_c1_g2_i1:158-1585(+)